MAKEENKKTKRPTALKRDIRNEKMRMISKSFKSNVRTTMRHFEEALKSKEKENIQAALNNLYSAVDRSVKRGIYKPNKAARIKARSAKKILAV
jgi:small subunit ribosomal protein S20